MLGGRQGETEWRGDFGAGKSGGQSGTGALERRSPSKVMGLPARSAGPSPFFSCLLSVFVENVRDYFFGNSLRRRQK